MAIRHGQMKSITARLLTRADKPDKIQGMALKSVIYRKEDRKGDLTGV